MIRDKYCAQVVIYQVHSCLWLVCWEIEQVSAYMCQFRYPLSIPDGTGDRTLDLAWHSGGETEARPAPQPAPCVVTRDFLNVVWENKIFITCHNRTDFMQKSAQIAKQSHVSRLCSPNTKIQPKPPKNHSFKKMQLICSITKYTNTK